MGFILIAFVLWLGFDYVGSQIKRVANTLEKQDRLLEQNRWLVVSKETYDHISNMKIIRK